MGLGIVGRRGDAASPDLCRAQRQYSRQGSDARFECRAQLASFYPELGFARQGRNSKICFDKTVIVLAGFLKVLRGEPHNAKRALCLAKRRQ